MDSEMKRDVIRRRIKSVYLSIRSVFLRGGAFFLKKRGDHSEPSPESIRKILVIGVPRIGDAAMSLHLFSNLKRSFPHAFISVLANAYVAEIYKLDINIDRVLIDSGNFIVSLKKVRSKRYELLIDLTCGPVLRNAFLSYLSCAHMTVGFNYYNRGIFFDHPADMPEHDQHITEIFNDLLAEINVRSTDAIPKLRISEKLHSESLELLRSRNLNEGHGAVIALHPGGHHPSQRWPIEYFIKLAKIIAERTEFRVVFLAHGQVERELEEQKFFDSDQGIMVIRGISVRELVGIISMVDLVICNNSGPLNIAVALGTNTVSFLGPTRKDTWYPVGDRHCVLMNESLDCLGCNEAVCPNHDHACLKNIDPEYVFEMILKTSVKNDKKTEEIIRDTVSDRPS
jgi:heptosyltransferase-2/heptosyltransferase-3